MPTLRTPQDQQLDGAIEELEALTAGNRTMAARRSGPDQVTLAVGTVTWLARVIARSSVSARDVQELIATEARGSKVIVARQLSSEAKDLLMEHNRSQRTFAWSWLDRRGELQLNNPKSSGTLQFQGERPGQHGPAGGSWPLAAPSSDGPIRGRAGMNCAAALLLQPDDPPSIRTVARQAGMSHGAIGEAMKLLQSSGLLRPDGRPELPDLFWALAAVWRPTRATPVASLPTQQVASRLRANFDGPVAAAMIPGWCVAGDEATSTWGAPMFIAGSRPWIWVPAEADARRAERVLVAAPWDDCRAVVAVPPSALVTLHRTWPEQNHGPLPFLPTAHPLFLALDLAQDPARGREILDQWHPDQQGITRVW